MRKWLTPACMLAAGLALGVLSRVLDIYTQNLGNVFSQFAVWILIGTVVSVYSRTQKRAMLYVLLLCAGMLVTYYITAAVTQGVYSRTFILGWTAFALCTPVLAYAAWLAKERGTLAFIIRIGIPIISFTTSILFFDRLRVYDFLLNAVLVYVLFFKKVNRRL